MAIEIVSFPINSMVDLSIVFCKRLPGRVTPFFMRGISHQLGIACQLLSWVSHILAPLARL